MPPAMSSTNDRAERRIVVIVLDDANLPADAMVSTTAAQVARAVVDHLGAEDLASVTFTDQRPPAERDGRSRAAACGDRFDGAASSRPGTP
jgi:hypothetical protein